MKAFILEKYGPPEVLQMAEVEEPAPAADEALVRVLAVSVNPADWRSMRAKPFFSRATLGLLRPKHRIPGVDVAGRVEAVGSGVTQFKPGDEVYANLLDHGSGGFAEYVSVPVEVMALKPANLSFEEAAAVPMAGVTALHGLRHHGEIKAGQRVLINGASGGIGTHLRRLLKGVYPSIRWSVRVVPAGHGEQGTDQRRRKRSPRREYLTMQVSAWNPSLMPIFLPSSYVRPEYEMPTS